jgi:hypothetical protein
MNTSTRSRLFAGLSAIVIVSAPSMTSAQRTSDFNAPVTEPGSPTAVSPVLGAHALAFYRCGGTGGLATAPVTTQSSGSTILAWIGRGKLSTLTTATTPTDNKGNVYSRLGSVQTYSPLWPSSGEALYVSPLAAGGAGHIITAPMPGADEVTLATIEIKNGGIIQDYKWSKVLSGQAHTSLSVTTTEPATLITIWAGDSSGDPTAGNVTAIPDNGFSAINSQLYAGCGVEAVVATKDVAAAGTYNVTWTATPTQGAHLWLVAVQKTSP